MADIQAALVRSWAYFAGPWLESGLIGTVMTVGGIAGMIMTTPAGAMIDATTNKRTFVIIPASSLSCLRRHSCLAELLGVAASQVATAIAGAAIVPAVTGSHWGSRIRRVSTAERSQSGFQSRWQYGGRGAIGLPRMEVWFRRGVYFGSCVRCAVDHFVLIIPRKAIDDHVAEGQATIVAGSQQCMASLIGMQATSCPGCCFGTFPFG